MSEHVEAGLLDEYALGGLDALNAARVAAHLNHCAECRAGYAEARAVFDVLPHALEERPADAALFERIAARIETREPAPEPAAPAAGSGWFANPLVRALAAALILALAGDAWFALRAAGGTAQVVAVASPSAVPVQARTPAPVHTALPASTPSPARTPLPASTPDPGLRREIDVLAAALAEQKTTAAERDRQARAEIARLERALAGARGAVRVVYVTPAPQAPPTPDPRVALGPAPEIVTALRTGRVFAVDGTVGNEPWHLTIVQPVGNANALIFSGTPHAPEGQTYRTWVVRAGKTYDAGALPPAEPTTLEMPMPLQSGDVVAFSREPLGSGDHPTQPFLMKVTISE